MARGNFYCPADECRYNHGGTCSARGESLSAPINVIQYPAKTYGGDYLNSMPGGTTGHTGPDESPTWRDWESCPYIHRHEV